MTFTWTALTIGSHTHLWEHINNLATAVANALAIFDTAWTAPTLTNSWVNYETTPATYHPAGYRVVGNDLELRGLIKSGTPSVAIFTLPIGARPTFSDRFLCEASGGTVSISVASSGVVRTEVYSAGATNTFVSLAGIRVSLL